MLNHVKQLNIGLNILFSYEECIDWLDTELRVIHKQADWTSEPEHSNSWYVAIGCVGSMEHPRHEEILKIEGWKYEDPYYCFYYW